MITLLSRYRFIFGFLIKSDYILVKLSGVQGEPGTKKRCDFIRSTRRTLYEKRLFSFVSGEPGAKRILSLRKDSIRKIC